MREFLQMLDRAHLLTWRREIRSRVGCFVVKKKANMQRLVIDARWSNRLCRPPPHSRLAVPAALSRLLAGHGAERVDRDGMLEQGACGGASWQPEEDPGDHMGGWPIRGYSVDLTDGFYEFKCARIVSLFGLGVSMTVKEVESLLGREVKELFDDREGRSMPTAPTDWVEAAFEGPAPPSPPGRLPAPPEVQRPCTGDGAVRRQRQHALAARADRRLCLRPPRGRLAPEGVRAAGSRRSELILRVRWR